MIDTVVLSIPRSKTVSLDLTSRGVEPWDLQSRTKAYDKYVRNPSPQEEALGLYFPRITVYRRRGDPEPNLRIEFSVPKLIYLNNLDELVDAQFDEVIERLQDRINRMGIAISAQTLKDAAVTVVHYSKNIELKNGYTSHFVISELGKINLNKRFDITRARYMNDGQSICAYAIAHSVIFYDKVADLKRSPKRAIDKDQTSLQLSLFEKVEMKEVLRFEIRLSQKQKVNALFKQLGFREDPTFRDVFSSLKAKAVLNHYWHKMIEGHSIALFANSLTCKDLLRQILIARKLLKGKAAIYLVGLILLSREGHGMRELRTILGKKSRDRTWYRMASDLKDISKGLAKLRPRDWYDQVKAALSDYKPYRNPNVAKPP